MKIYQNRCHGSNPINQSNAISNVSEKYQFLPTNDLIQTIESKGFIKKSVSYSNVRKIEKAGFQNHLVIFEHPQGKIDGQNLNLILKNSHDGTAAVKLMLGVYRLVCANGMIVGDSFSDISIPHKGTEFYSKVDNGLNLVLGQFNNLIGTIEKWQNIELTDYEKRDLALKCIKLRYDLFDEKNKQNQIEFLQKQSDDKYLDHIINLSLQPLRHADRKNDLYTVYNVLQEKLIRGGIPYVNNKQTRLSRCRKINSIDVNVKLNQKSWNFAEQLAA